MSSLRFPFAVRLIGFSPQEVEIFDATFALEQEKRYGYFRLSDENLQDPDLYIANADELKALVALADLRPSDVRPVLLVGSPDISLPYASVQRPIRWNQLFEALDSLIEKRADALSRLEASDVVAVPERRRRERLDIDLTDPSEYQRMRAPVARDGGILIIDKTPAFRDHVAELLNRQRIAVSWAGSDQAAIESFEQQSTTVVIINTSTPAVDPYRLCQALKRRNEGGKTIVIFLVAKPSDYEVELARHVCADGFLTKPVATHHLMAVLKKFLPLAR